MDHSSHSVSTMTAAKPSTVIHVNAPHGQVRLRLGNSRARPMVSEPSRMAWMMRLATVLTWRASLSVAGSTMRNSSWPRSMRLSSRPVWVGRSLMKPAQPPRLRSASGPQLVGSANWMRKRRT